MDQLEEKILRAFPLDEWSRRRVCLAISGGADSVALVRAFVAIARDNMLQPNALCVATVNHGLRGAESDGDVAFVQDLGTKLGVQVVVQQIDPSALRRETQRLGSLESAARNLRYELLSATAKEFGARFLATAHHADDQLETTLFRLFRGSGFDGLQGMASARPLDPSLTLTRPMLAITRREILEYLARLGQDYRVDSSNLSPEFSRNRIRNELIPLLDQIFPNRWRGALSRLAEQCRETNAFLDERVAELERELEREARRLEKYRQTLRELNVAVPAEQKLDDGVELPIKPLLNAPTVVLKRYFMKLWRKLRWPCGDMGSDEWRRLVATIKQKKASRTLPGNVATLFPNDDAARLQRLAPHGGSR